MTIRESQDVIKLLILILYAMVPELVSAQEADSTRTKINNFTAAVTVQSKGISTIPNLTLGKPAAVFDLKIGRKLTFEPQFRFALDGKPWAMVFWWRYYGSISDKFKVTLHTNYSFSYRSINSYTSSGAPQEIIRTTRYLVGAVAPSYQVNRYVGIGMYFFYNYGIEKFITRNTLMISFRPAVNIPVSKDISVRVTPEIYHLVMDDDNGTFINTSFLISKKNFPLAVSGLINKPIKSNIPSEYDFLWNVGLSYTFNRQYIEK